MRTGLPRKVARAKNSSLTEGQLYSIAVGIEQGLSRGGAFGFGLKAKGMFNEL
jgi:hypothetical protein